MTVNFTDMTTGNVTSEATVVENGLEAIERMRSDTGQIMPAVLVTGDASSAVREHAGQMPQCYVLSKPVNTDELLSLIHRWAPAE